MVFIDALREAGFVDGEILEINQVVAHFAYANRTVTGLGVNTDGEVLGQSPLTGDDDSGWGTVYLCSSNLQIVLP